jgi:hypothetical protein
MLTTNQGWRCADPWLLGATASPYRAVSMSQTAVRHSLAGLARRSCVRRNRAILFFRCSQNRLNRGRNEAMCYLSDESPVVRGLSRRGNPRD